MRLRRWTALGIGALLALGCGGAAEDAGPRPEISGAELAEALEEASEIVDEQLASLAEKEAGRLPCSLFEHAEVEGLMGNDLEPGSYSFENVTEDDHRFQAEACSWGGSAEDANEIRLRVSRPRHFESGSVECAAPANADSGPWAPQSTPGLGDGAWWEYDKSWGMGTLLVCSAEARVKVEVDLAGDDNAAALAAARAMAEKVLARV